MAATEVSDSDWVVDFLLSSFAKKPFGVLRTALVAVVGAEVFSEAAAAFLVLGEFFFPFFFAAFFAAPSQREALCHPNSLRVVSELCDARCSHMLSFSPSERGRTRAAAPCRRARASSLTPTLIRTFSFA